MKIKERKNLDFMVDSILNKIEFLDYSLAK